ncbi:hypothetical protein Q4543_12230 [Salipiger sp. 1_MG-2023]|uniref:hypothetical protein n=1 Tax=Salipiger sp. 1_MG-2023 TaxID=3062665 RepID=UPI0026E2E99F|nr:hypothetical protein [Salipiger sp. 1_MG-2023]MDO6586281.1 hypothetical protein [Salipiger sp. 1_MG-2023]
MIAAIGGTGNDIFLVSLDVVSAVTLSDENARPPPGISFRDLLEGQQVLDFTDRLEGRDTPECHDAAGAVVELRIFETAACGLGFSPGRRGTESGLASALDAGMFELTSDDGLLLAYEVTLSARVTMPDLAEDRQALIDASGCRNATRPRSSSGQPVR